MPTLNELASEYGSQHFSRAWDTICLCQRRLADQGFHDILNQFNVFLDSQVDSLISARVCFYKSDNYAFEIKANGTTEFYLDDNQTFKLIFTVDYLTSGPIRIPE